MAVTGTDNITISTSRTASLLLELYFTPILLDTLVPVVSSLPVMVISICLSFKKRAIHLPNPRVPPITATFREISPHNFLKQKSNFNIPLVTYMNYPALSHGAHENLIFSSPQTLMCLNGFIEA